MNRFTFLGLALLIVIVSLGCFFIFPEKKYKYHIHDQHRLFKTNEYKKDSDGCIIFLQKDQKQVQLCGTYTIEER
jgi:hypothetical protein